MHSSVENFLKTGNFGTPLNTIPFDAIEAKDFVPAIEKAIEIARSKIAQIKQSEASFKTVIEGLETSSEAMDRMVLLYFNLFAAHATDDLKALAQKISGMSAEFSSEVNLDANLFKQIKKVYDQRASLNLSKEQNRLLGKTYKSFVRNGALLEGASKEKLKAIDQELAQLSPTYSDHVLKATNAFTLNVTEPKRLEGIPEGVLEEAAAEAKKREQSGWTFTLQAPSLLPFLKYCPDETLRKEMWFAYASRSFKSSVKEDSFDNQEQVLKTVRLRHERAKLLGFATHADYVLEERMAKNPATVRNFMQNLLGPSRKAAEKDLQDLRAFRKQLEGKDSIQPWDFAYYSEKLRKHSFDLSEEELRPYFKLENAVGGIFEIARRLYGVVLTRTNEFSTYHPEVETYRVTDEKTGDLIGVFYADFFPRETKRGGAWMTYYLDQGLFAGQVQRPHVAIVCNFTKPTATKPSLLTFDEVETLFHEFGHALHMLLSQCHYRSLGGTNVYWDFVELPSQIMENWLHEREVLLLFAKHYETGVPIPDSLIEKIKKADKFQAGYASLRQLAFGFLDMTWHSHPNPEQITDVDAFESQALDITRIFPHVPGTNISCSFSHIFAGGYSAGYYSYKWAEVLDADAFEYFEEKGLFDQEVARKFKDFILSRGDTEHPAELYRQFRGRDPDPHALLRRSGLELQ